MGLGCFFFSWRPLKTEFLQMSSKTNYSQLNVHSFFGASLEHLARKKQCQLPSAKPILKFAKAKSCDLYL